MLGTILGRKYLPQYQHRCRGGRNEYGEFVEIEYGYTSPQFGATVTQFGSFWHHFQKCWLPTTSTHIGYGAQGIGAHIGAH